jgi:hypothetical protein
MAWYVMVLRRLEAIVSGEGWGRVVEVRNVTLRTPTPPPPPPEVPWNTGYKSRRQADDPVPDL